MVDCVSLLVDACSEDGAGASRDGGGGLGGGAAVWYLTGDSFSRKSRREGSRSRKGSLELLLVEVLLPNHPENQPIEEHALGLLQ